jgi:hypothetical protein
MRQTVNIAIIAVVTLMLLPSARAEGLARIYVYVQLETPARSWFPILCDGTVVAKLKRGRFFVVNVAPGRHMLSDKEGVPVFVDVRSGEKSFIYLEWRNGEVPGPALPVWTVADRDRARRDMIYLTYIDADKALSKSVPKTDPREGPQPRLRRRSDTDDE